MRITTSVPLAEVRKSGVTRQRLIDSSLRLLLERGFVQITTPEIARAAGESREALTYHFDSKEELAFWKATLNGKKGSDAARTEERT